LKANAAGGGIFRSRNGGDIGMLRITHAHVSGAYHFQVLAEAPRLSRATDLLITLSLQVGNDMGSAVMSCESGGAITCW
jgi:hypothetical protein